MDVNAGGFAIEDADRGVAVGGCVLVVATVMIREVDESAVETPFATGTRGVSGLVALFGVWVP